MVTDARLSLSEIKQLANKELEFFESTIWNSEKIAVIRAFALLEEVAYGRLLEGLLKHNRQRTRRNSYTVIHIIHHFAKKINT
jgi:hypothetical protein